MKEKMKKESNILKLSLILSAIFVIVELAMAIIGKSQAMLVDCVFGIADLVIMVIISVLLPLIYKPVTEKRPYGYSQVESIFIIVKGISIGIITIFLIMDNIEIILNGGSKLNASWLVICQVILEAFNIISYAYLKNKSKKVNTPVISVDLIEWKIGMVTTLGMFTAFLMQFILEYTRFSFIAPYIDSVFAIVISVIMLQEPIKMVVEAFKSLILFAPEKDTLEEIKKIVKAKIRKYPYDVTFYDVVRTGRKIWIELYIKSYNSNINLKELKEAKKEVEEKLKEEFEEIYVEFTPEI